MAFAHSRGRTGCILTAVLAVGSHVLPGESAFAQPAPPLEVTVTANRISTAIQRTGSAITVIRTDEIAARNPASMVDVLRQVPGVSVAEAGGPGGTSDIRLRGANPNHTLVLIDGVRVNDPAQASGEFDTAVIAPSLIERIEVLRGPQSALYGSDAIGGVVNIITKRGRGRPVFSLSVEGGRYGTLSTVGSAAGTIGPWSFAFSGALQRSDGFSRYGHRIGRLDVANNDKGVRGGGLEADGFSRIGGYGRLGYDPGTGFRAEVSVLSVKTEADFDAGSSAAVPGATVFPDTGSRSTRHFQQVNTRLELDAFEGALSHQLQFFAARTDREFINSSLARVGNNLRETRSRSDFIGDRVGAEYQATLRIPSAGTLIGGVRFERETADSFERNILPTPGLKRRTLTGQQETTSVFGLWQMPIGERLTVSLGGRHDKVSERDAITTWRATAAYNLTETGTVFRASAGTGAKAATLFQRFSPIGNRDLLQERSLGVDAGIDQSLLDGRVRLSVTAFANRLRNLIQFESTAACLAQIAGNRCYVNVDRATTSGIEASARVGLIDGVLTATGTYTYLHAKDRSTGLTLARRPQHTGRIGLQWTPIADLSIEPSVTLVSHRFSQSGERQRLAPYARFDIHASYKIHENLKLHARVENITNARYQEVYNFGTTGRAAYAGLTATW